MQVLKTIKDLDGYLNKSGGLPYCLVDTGFLYAMAYDDDRLYDKAIETSEILSTHKISIFTNVISRMEFIDLIFRKQVTMGAIKLYGAIDSSTVSKKLFNILKNIRDQDTAHRNEQKSYKVGEDRIKNLRNELELSSSQTKWKEFCKLYSGKMLSNEWALLEQEFGLNFVEVMDGQISPLFNEPLNWKDMVNVMGEYGLRGPDAMIANLFSKSKFPLLITSDSDFEHCFTDSLEYQTEKAIFIL